MSRVEQPTAGVASPVWRAVRVGWAQPSIERSGSLPPLARVLGMAPGANVSHA